MTENRFSNDRNSTAPSLVAVSHDELRHVAGGSVVSKLKSAAKWVYNHVVPSHDKLPGKLL